MTVLLIVIVLHCCGSWRSCAAVPNHNSSVLPAFSCRCWASHVKLFCYFHYWMFTNII